jgi:hypothetical protein
MQCMAEAGSTARSDAVPCADSGEPCNLSRDGSGHHDRYSTRVSGCALIFASRKSTDDPLPQMSVLTSPRSTR